MTIFSSPIPFNYELPPNVIIASFIQKCDNLEALALLITYYLATGSIFNYFKFHAIPSLSIWVHIGQLNQPIL